MVEYFTQAIVLGREDLNETDSLVYFYTEELGKVTAKARGLKKPLSKSNPHLRPLNFVEARFVAGRNGNYQLIDALPVNYTSGYSEEKDKNLSFEDSIKLLKAAEFVKEMTFDFQQDLHLWHGLKKAITSNLEEKVIYRLLLKILGFDLEHASCVVCHSLDLAVFHKKDHVFLCGEHSLRAGENEVILV